MKKQEIQYFSGFEKESRAKKSADCTKTVVSFCAGIIRKVFAKW